ncbi:hypothetical protein HanPI659440_Chr12g0466771 [Helianthus annuus]|nr:hypothetical protein HanPI659440_Chr12g0466771 [Helianthus annuus]
MPYLKFTSQDFPKYLKFSKFVTHVLSRRNNLTEVYSLKLTFRGKASQAVVKRILNYAFSRNIQQLDVANICVSDPEDANAHQIVCLLQQLHNVHSLTLNLEIAEVLYNSILQ